MRQDPLPAVDHKKTRRSGPFCLGKRGRHQKRETGIACLPLLVPSPFANTKGAAAAG